MDVVGRIGDLERLDLKSSKDRERNAEDGSGKHCNGLEILQHKYVVASGATDI